MDITSFVLGMKMGKNSGGGSSADVRYVTFMNGNEVLYVKPVAVGDDCVDVLTKGLISTPTRESTAQYNYAYSGWSIANDDTVDSDALTNVTEDRTVYACFAATVRSYTITYYDEDGTTILNTETLEYGTTPIYTPSKTGYTFEGWIPDITTVTGDTSYTVKGWKSEVSFATSDWAAIAAICEAGQAADYFSVGDTRTEKVKYGTKTYNVKMKIAGIGHDDLADGSGKAGITVMTHTVLSFRNFDFGDTSGVTSMGYRDAPLSVDVETVFETYFPSAFAVAKSVTKKFNNSLRSTHDVTLYEGTFKAFLPCVREAGFPSSVTSNLSMTIPESGTCYELYATDYLGNNSSEISRVNSTANATYYSSPLLTRDAVGAHYSTTTGYQVMYLSSSKLYSTGSDNTGVFGFCI